jgi:EAL domain-containing protein (putative c-di-GMP-specific phosphodiesterase class I)
LSTNDPDLTSAVSQAIDPMLLMQRVTDRTLELIDVATGVMVGLADDTGVTYVCGAGHRISALGTRVGMDSSLSGLSIRTGEILQSPDTQSDPRVDADACRRLDVASLVCIPLTWMYRPIGVLAVNSSKTDAFTAEHVASLTRLAEFVSVAIGSACDISRVGTELIDLDRDELATGRTRAPEAELTNRYVMSILSSDAGIRLDAEERIRRVIDDPAVLSMVFQPIVELATGRVEAFESLARFQVAPYRPPDLWFREAQACGLGIDLEVRAIRLALEHLGRLPDGTDISINVGPELAMSPRFADLVPDLPASRIILELTEHTPVTDYPSLIAVLHTLRRGGMRVAVDDTGSGYSSLAHILKLAPDFIKLDIELVRGIDLDPVRRALAASLVAFAADTGADIIAEGIETEDEADVLRHLGVKYGQGYHLGAPAALAVSAAKVDGRPPHRPD